MNELELIRQRVQTDTHTIADVPKLLRIIDELNAMYRSESSATINRAVTGDGEPNRFGSIAEMLVEFKRREIAELEDRLARIAAIIREASA